MPDQKRSSTAIADEIVDAYDHALINRDADVEAAVRTAIDRITSALTDRAGGQGAVVLLAMVKLHERIKEAFWAEGFRPESPESVAVRRLLDAGQPPS